MKDVMLIKSIDAGRYRTFLDEVLSTFTLEKKPTLYFYGEKTKPVILSVEKSKVSGHNVTAIYSTSTDDIDPIQDILLEKVINRFNEGSNDFVCDAKKSLLLFDSKKQEIVEGKFSWVPAFVPELSAWVLATYSLVNSKKSGVCLVKQDSDNLIFLAALQKKSEQFIMPKDYKITYDGSNLLYFLQSKLWGFSQAKPTSAALTKFIFPQGEIPLISDKLFSKKIDKIVEEPDDVDNDNEAGMYLPKPNSEIKSVTWMPLSEVLQNSETIKTPNSEYIHVVEDIKIDIGLIFSDIHFRNGTISFYVDGKLPNLDDKEDELKTALKFDKIFLFDKSENILHNQYIDLGYL